MITCTFENGKKTSLRHVVVDIIVVANNKILLVKRAPHMSNPNKWGLVGGYVDRDEWIEETIKRETLEETGYKIKLKALFRINDNPHRRGEDRQNIVFVYIAKALEKVAEPDAESTKIKWFDLDDLPKPEYVAFDHFEQIQLYLKHLKQPFQLPIVGKIYPNVNA